MSGVTLWLFKMVSASFEFYEWFIIANIIFSWIRVNPNSKIVSFVSSVTDPFLEKIASFLPRALVYPLDFSPVVAIVLLNVARRFVLTILVYLLA